MPGRPRAPRDHDARARGRTHHEKREVGGCLTALFTALPDLRLDLTTRLPHGDLVAEDTFYVDLAGVLGQMGLFPPLDLAESRRGRAGLRVAVLLRSPRRVLAARRAGRGGRGRRAWPGDAAPEDAGGPRPPT